MNNDGITDPPCRGVNAHIGRLPWKTLGLPDLRDGSGERLWYAVSSNFVDNTDLTARPIQCLAPADPSGGCLNSGTTGYITVRSRIGAVINDGTGTSAAIAVIIAPGSILNRVDNVSQDRSCSGDTNVAQCQQTGICTGPSARCNPINYLDVAQPPVLTVTGATGSAEDNATFAESTTTDGFITGPISDSSGLVRVNDVVMTLTSADVMPTLERRVGQELINCLKTYATANSGRYPWAADVSQAPSSYNLAFADGTQFYFGHFPDSLINTRSSSGSTMANAWPAAGCNLGTTASAATWWMNWKDLVYYAVAPAYAPNATLPLAGCTGSDCLTVDPISGGNSARVAVFIAGRALTGESRASSTDWNDPSNYLEGTNATTAASYAAWLSAHPVSPPPPTWPFAFESSVRASTFNDTVSIQ
jgi:hypothetical protein